MAGTVKIKARMVVCPHENLLGEPERSTWPIPARMPVRITGGTAQIEPCPTSVKGLTKLMALPHGTYRVALLGTDFEAGTLKLTTSTSDNDVLEVRLVPHSNHRLVLMQVTDSRSGTGLSGASVTITSADGKFTKTFTSYVDGYIYGTVPDKYSDASLQFNPYKSPSGESLIPAASTVDYPVETTEDVGVVSIPYYPAIEISITPTVKAPDGVYAATDTTVTVEYRGGSPGVIPFSDTASLAAGSTISFTYAFSGVYEITVKPPTNYKGIPIEDSPKKFTPMLYGPPGFSKDVEFTVVPTEKVAFRIETPQNQPLKGSFPLQIMGPDNLVQQVTVTGTSFTADVPRGESVKIQLDAAALPMVNVPEIGGDVPLVMSQSDQSVVFNETNTIVLQYEHSLTIQAVDEQGRAVSGGMVDVYYEQQQNAVATVVVDQQGSFVLGLANIGTYYLAPHTVGGMGQQRESIPVNPPNAATVTFPGRQGTPARNGEAITDLSAYPVLTEEVSTTGVPTPVTGGPGGGGGTGAGYGQTVDQAMRDVLGWRPSGDVAGFQAALTGAFQLREVEGHTAWSWQQRGYAVQADMGGLTGAQASIYARAKAALDQIQPLLAGLTTLNPAQYEPQDLETIRSVVGTELQELVNELAWEGGPRIQRVDELFRLLLGEGYKSLSMDPDLVQGNLGTLRQRFALTVDEIQTVDEERIVTNFRIIVEQVLALYASWQFDRKLLSGIGPKAALGTILIWLSRGLEAVCESVGDLLFALDSVYVDAAQRQVIELRFAGLTVAGVPMVPFRGNPPKTMPYDLKQQAPMFLSDLLDWVLRASQDEGPRIIQDAGKDGVLAFKPILNSLRTLVRATAQIAREQNAVNAMPAGMRTPRVDRALKVLAAQLDEAANLASLVRVELAPQIASASIFLPGTTTLVSEEDLLKAPRIEIAMTGSNFRGPATAILMAEQNEDLPNLLAKAKINTPSTAHAVFDNPGMDSDNAGTTWVVAIVNNDETQSVPTEVLRVPRRFSPGPLS
jgi:hypothetical protein